MKRVGVSRVVRTAVMVGLLSMVATTAVAQEADLRERLGEQQRDRERSEQRLDEVREQEGDARTRLERADRQLDQAQAALEDLEAQLEAAREERDDAREQVRVARRALERVTARMARTEAELDETQAQLDGRIRAAFKYGQISFTEAFTGVRDVADFLNSTTYVGHVMSNDKELVETVVALLDEVEAQRAEAQQARLDGEREAQRAEAAAREVERATVYQQELTEQVEDRRAEREAALEALREDRSSIEGHLEGLDAEASKIQSQLAEIARQQAEAAERRAAEERAAEQAAAEQAAAEQRAAEQRAAEQRAQEQRSSAQQPAPSPAPSPSPSPSPGGGGGAGSAPAPSNPPSAGPAPSSGEWQRPSSGRISSGFGPRWGRNHNGVDIAAGVGTPVVATRGGTVVHVTSSCHPTSSWGCGGGFGNYVVVDHGDGFGSVYAHLSSVSVGSGQSVGRGGSIGQIGNSGNSYGAHLHFEIRQAGRPQNPCSYISC
jgi:murein DD-endopeptidase MepM/ murein hydrolase activator NlpD